MTKYINTEELANHKFLDVKRDSYFSDERRKSDAEVYAYKVGYNDAIDDITQFAPADDIIEQKTGKWIMKKIYENNYGFKKYRYFCSECNTPAFIMFQPFCSNCGAKMKL